MPESDSRRTFAAAAQAFAELVDRIPDDAWTGPGLGDWDLRALVGHASRSLVTVLTYLPRIAETEAVPTTAAYYAAAAQIMAAVTERGRQAGAALGNDPAATVRTLVRDCARALAATTDDPVIESIAGGMRLSGYLVTRTFELVVHSLDIAAATGLSYDPPADALAESLALAVDVAVDRGQGSRLLLALTGRASLASGFSVV